MKPLHNGRQHGFLQREAEQHVSSNTDVADVFVATGRAASGRVLERQFRPARWRNGGSRSVSVLAGLNQAERAMRFRCRRGHRRERRWPSRAMQVAGTSPRWCRRRHGGGRRRGIPAACPPTHALVADGAARASWSNRWDFSATRASFAPVKLESLTGIVGSRTNSSTAMLYAVERGAGVGVLPTCSIAFGRAVGRVRCGRAVSPRSLADLSCRPQALREAHGDGLLAQSHLQSGYYACSRMSLSNPRTWSPP
jgi:hypothetical protein